MLKIVNCLICDDVRREDNGKELLIGVYSANMIVSKFPAGLPVALWGQFTSSQEGDFTFAVRVVSPEDTEFATATVQIQKYKANDVASFAVKGLPAVAHTRTQLRFQAKFEGEEWKTLKELTIEKGVVRGTLETPPTS